ncbi:MAG TPA: ElyC/SanA/YdcF family protein [Mycobacteriales bacterium]|nr:ElyC/SanA/YdcF family protein [Mycobacteriales bacterium]
MERRWPAALSRRTVVRAVHWSAAASLAVLGLVLGTQAYLYWSTRSARYDRPDQVPAAPVALVLGARVAPDGTPSLLLARRLDLAVTLYRRGTVRAVLASGDNGSRRYDEVTAMLRYLRARGVPADRAVGDYAGFDTWASCTRARRVFGVTAAVVITQRFHLPRAVALCRRAGITSYGLGDDSMRDLPGLTVRLQARELLAGVKAAWTLLTRPDPHFLGPHEPALDPITTST